ncbi:MAG: hypothetical protein PHD21_05015 [Flavobacteriales bacterium]|nr:hypothetical protein [Flavobacteriales bacterium]
MNIKLKYIISIVSVLAFIGLAVFLENKTSNTKAVRTQVMQASGYGFADVDAIRSLVEKNTNDVQSDSLSKRLFSIEDKITKNPYIERSVVYLQPSGEILVQLWEEIPLARVINDSVNYYLCTSGKNMPVKVGVGASVPMVFGRVNKDNVDGVKSLLASVKGDSFFNKIFVGLRINTFPTKKGSGYCYTVDTRLDGLKVIFGDQRDMTVKMDNFKIIYNYLSEQDRIKEYKSVNLEFVNYIICTKK